MNDYKRKGNYQTITDKRTDWRTDGKKSRTTKREVNRKYDKGCLSFARSWLLLFLAQIFVGVGSSHIYSYGASYIDDHADKSKSPLFFGRWNTAKVDRQTDTDRQTDRQTDKQVLAYLLLWRFSYRRLIIDKSKSPLFFGRKRKAVRLCLYFFCPFYFYYTTGAFCLRYTRR